MLKHEVGSWKLGIIIWSKVTKAEGPGACALSGVNGCTR